MHVPVHMSMISKENDNKKVKNQPNISNTKIAFSEDTPGTRVDSEGS